MENTKEPLVYVVQNPDNTIDIINSDNSLTNVKSIQYMKESNEDNIAIENSDLTIRILNPSPRTQSDSSIDNTVLSEEEERDLERLLNLRNTSIFLFIFQMFFTVSLYYAKYEPLYGFDLIVYTIGIRGVFLLQKPLLLLYLIFEAINVFRFAYIISAYYDFLLIFMIFTKFVTMVVVQRTVFKLNSFSNINELITITH